MQLYLIRHAESENNSKPLYERVEDPPITAVGRLQAQHLADWAQTLRIDSLITSPFLRSLQTTRWILDRTPQHVHVWHDVYESGGCFRGHGPDAKEGSMGLGRAQILGHLSRDQDACTIDATIGEAGWWGGRDRETDDEAVQRTKRVAKRFVDTFGASGDVVVAVIHADLKRLLLAELLQGIVDPFDLGPVRNTGITKVDFEGSRWRLDWFNSVSHLPAKLVTSVNS